MQIFLKSRMILSLLLISGSLWAQGKDYIYKVGDKSYEGFYIKQAKPAPLVVILHDWDGLTDYEKKRAQMLFKEGYSVFVPDLFGQGIRPTENKDKKQHTGELYKNRVKMRSLIQAAWTESKKLGMSTQSTSLMGYCFGGAGVLEVARQGIQAKGFVTFHGGLSTPKGQSYENSQGKFLVFHGTSDSHITMKDFAALADELDKNKLPHELITFGGAPHAFTVFDSPAYRQEADEVSWKRYLEFLREVHSI